MEMRVPIFAGRRILKKESLWDIRDYTYAGWQLYYAEYTDGLLKAVIYGRKMVSLSLGREC